MNKITIFILLLYSNNSFGNFTIGYGASDAVLPAKNQELFYLGFKLGLDTHIDLEKRSIKLITSQKYSGSQIGALEAAQELTKNGAQLLVGFPTSHEALMAATFCEKQNSMCIFSGAGHENLGKLGSYVITTGESMEYSVSETIKFIKKQKLGKKGVVIINPYAVFSNNQAVVFKNQSKEEKQFQLTYVELNKNKSLEASSLEEIKSADFIVVTQYADESVKMLEFFKQHGIDKPIVTNSSWTTGDIEFVRRYLVERKNPVYSAILWFEGSSYSKPFEKLLLKKYGKTATSEIAYGYDLGVIVGKTLNSIKGEVSLPSVVDSFYKQLCFNETSSGKICFNKNGGHALRTIKFVKFHKNGFKEIN